MKQVTRAADSAGPAEELTTVFSGLREDMGERRKQEKRDREKGGEGRERPKRGRVKGGGTSLRNSAYANRQLYPNQLFPHIYFLVRMPVHQFHPRLSVTP